MNQLKKSPYIKKLCMEVPQAIASIQGNSLFPEIRGTAAFYEIEEGVVVSIWIEHLPDKSECDTSIFACHIHDGNSCKEVNQMYPQAGVHLNLKNCNHPYHSGDLAPLFMLSSHSAFLSMATSRFKISDIIGKVLIIHDSIDDFMTQPSGNSGNMIACGKILKIKLDT